jgi:hypothetical protein
MRIDVSVGNIRLAVDDIHSALMAPPCALRRTCTGILDVNHSFPSKTIKEQICTVKKTRSLRAECQLPSSALPAILLQVNRESRSARGQLNSVSVSICIRLKFRYNPRPSRHSAVVDKSSTATTFYPTLTKLHTPDTQIHQ